MAVSVLGAVLSIGACDCGDTNAGLGRLEAEADFSPKEIDFGRVPLGAVKRKTVDVTNSGQIDLQVCLNTSHQDCAARTVVLPPGGPFTVDFEARDEIGNWVVHPGTDRDFVVRFSPTQAGVYEATLELVHNAADGAETIHLRGAAIPPDVSVSDSGLDFGEVTVLDRKSLPLTLTNNTPFGQPFTVAPPPQTSISFGTTLDGVETEPGQTLVGTIAAGASVTMDVWFEPKDVGVFSSWLKVEFCPDCVQTVHLNGRGVRPVLEIDPPLVDFGEVEETVVAEQRVTLRNAGDGVLVVDSIALDAPPVFAIEVPELPVRLATGESAVVALRFSSALPGRYEGQLDVHSTAWDDPATPEADNEASARLLARTVGADIEALPGAIDFGVVELGHQEDRALLLTNVGNIPLRIGALDFDVSAGELTISGLPNLPLELAPGDALELFFHLRPTVEQDAQAVLRVMSNDREEPMVQVPVVGLGRPPRGCALSVAPSAITFGLVERGRRAVLPAELRNDGGQICVVRDLRLTGSPAFTLSGVATIQIPPGGIERIQVQYQPSAYGNHQASLDFSSTDALNPNVSVTVNGSSAPSAVRALPSELDFSYVPVTCGSPARAVTIYNTGTTPATIADIALDPTTSPEFELAAMTLPQTISAGGSLAVEMSYSPADIGPDAGVLFITAVIDRVTQRIAVPVFGEGRVSPAVTDVFRQVPSPQADVLFVVDNSCSMEEEQSGLGSNLGQFLSYAISEDIDFQVAVTTTDIDAGGAGGRFVGDRQGRVIRPTTPDAETVFAANVDLGTDGSRDEQGLEAAYLALTDPLINTDNAGFLRDDAALAVIVVSDEEDHSSRSLSFYENFLRNLKGFNQAGMFSMSAIVGTSQPSCRGPGGEALYADRYIRVSQNTGGVVESICGGSWGQALRNIGLNSFGLKRQFPLGSTPVASTVAVSVNGVVVPSVAQNGMARWYFDGSSNAVSFHADAVPQRDAIIEVTYSVACL